MRSNDIFRAGDLPIYEIERNLITGLKTNRRLVIQAPTGSGKSTQVPQMLLGHDLTSGQIVVLQPRRIAARMLASRVSQEMGVRLGGKVGYQIRFEDRSSIDTRIKYITEGILLRQMLSDPEIPTVGAIVFDEFHERHIYGDVSLGRAMQIQNAIRPDLKIIVMSATLDSELLTNYLTPCETIASKGRMFPVTVEYLDKAPDERKTPVWDLTVRELERILPVIPTGDILIFMPGAYEIGRTIQALRYSPLTKHCEILPLHGELPPAQQDAAVARYDKRKIVVSTNVAETSLTIDGISLVVDSGLARIARFDPNRGINTLLIEKISRASADQRTGRAGRTAPGHCLRLWSEMDHRSRPERETPEIKRIDLAEIVLTLKASGVTDMEVFPWIEPPDPLTLARAQTLLVDLGAIDRDVGAITQLGRRLIAFPVHPRYSRMLLAAHENGCIPTVALIAALTQERNLLLSRQGDHIEEERERKIGDSDESDFVALVRACQYAQSRDYSVEACSQVGVHASAARQAGRLRDFLLSIARSEGLNVQTDNTDTDLIARCILAGFSDHLASRVNMGHLRCELVHKRRGDLAKSSTVRSSRLLVACEIREIGGRKGEANVLLSLATAVRMEWLEQMFPEDLKRIREPFFDSAINRVVVEQRIVFRDLAIERKQSGAPTEEEAAVILAEELRSGRLALGTWDHSVEQWLARIGCLAAWLPELGIPVFTNDDKFVVLRKFCFGAFGYKDIKSKPVMPSLRAWLPAQYQALLARHAPERITLTNGREARVSYAIGAPPSISLPIQSLYGVNGTIKIAMNKVPVLIHILAPNQRPVQITQDMTGFWRDHYPAIKKEYQRKYPRHEWR